jgi:hypothetical protein
MNVHRAGCDCVRCKDSARANAGAARAGQSEEKLLARREEARRQIRAINRRDAEQSEEDE